MRILVLGSNGQLGKCLKEQIKYEGLRNTIFFSKSDLDISSSSDLELITKYKPNLIINTAAYTNVDESEINKNLANKVNNIAVKNLAKICFKNNIILIHISTDYVFDGTLNKAYNEEISPNPKNTYGITKLDGESSIIKSGCQYFIIRTSWVFSEYGKNFLKTMVGLFNSKKNINVVFDQTGCPTYAHELALAIIRMLPKIKNKKLNGIYNFSGIDSCSWYEFSKKILHHLDLKNKNQILIKKIKTKDLSLKARRPKNSSLDCKKFYEVFNFTHSELDQCIIRCIDKLKV